MNTQYPDDYADIIDPPHHVSKKHPQMPLIDRAAQFSPFAALSGYGESVEETARYVEEKLTLDESKIEQIDAVLQKLNPGDTVTVIYFLPDRKKLGGSYETITGTVKKIDKQNGQLVLEEKAIPFENIFAFE